MFLSTMPYLWIQPCLILVPWVRYSDSSVLILNTWRSSALSGKPDFPWTYLYKEKLDQKVAAGEIQQSIYGAVAGELDSRRV